MKLNQTLLLLLLFVIGCRNTSSKGAHKTALHNSPEKQATCASYNKEITDIALFIAGMPVEENSKLYAQTQTDKWKQYAATCDTSWNKYNRKVVRNIEKWIEHEIPNVSDSLKTVFYPFSGPDFLNADTYFPNATQYIMFGLEPHGTIPAPESIPEKSMNAYLNSFSNAINTLISRSFFRTNSMKEQFKTEYVDGALPIIMLFMARTDKKIIEIKPFKFEGEGNMAYLEKFKRYKGETCYGTGFKMLFCNSNSAEVKTLIYFSANIADGGLGINTPTRDYLKTIDNNCIGYVKSATYLMHKSYFSIIRNTLLDKSKIILQDDSGIKFSYFDKKKWTTQLYGTYNKPIALFGKHFDPELLLAYKKTEVKELPFRTGYDAKSNLLLARKKNFATGNVN